VLSAGLAALVNYFGHLLPGIDFFWQFVNFILSFVITTLLFGLIYKVLPDVKIAWSDVWTGAAITSVLFSIGRYLLGQYLGNSSFGSTYGAAGSLVVILFWVYYAAQILFFGAEFTQVYTRRYGSGIVPADYAVSVSEEGRPEQGMKPNSNDRAGQSSSNRPASRNFISRLFRRFTKPKRSKSRRNNRQP
jgi:membrane protein